MEARETTNLAQKVSLDGPAMPEELRRAVWRFGGLHRDLETAVRVENGSREFWQSFQAFGV